MQETENIRPELLAAACKSQAETLAVACHVGRLERGFESTIRGYSDIVHLLPLRKLGEPVTMEEHKFKIVRLALANGEEKIKVAERLNISRDTLDNILSRQGIKTRRKSSKVVQMVAGLMLYCLTSFGAGFTEPASFLSTNPPSLAQELNAAMMTAAVAPVTPKTNGVVSLVWNNPALPPHTVISNLSTKTAYDAGTNQAITIGKQPTGTNVFVAVGQFGNIAVLSNTLTNNVQMDTNRITFTIHSFKVSWPGPDGVLQMTTDFNIWNDVQPIKRGGTVLVTNTGLGAFNFRVRITSTNQ